MKTVNILEAEVIMDGSEYLSRLRVVNDIETASLPVLFKDESERGLNILKQHEY